MARDLAFVLPLMIALLLGPVHPALAGSEFDRLADSLEQRLGFERERIPGGWFVNSVLFVARPAGVKNMSIATFENVDGRSERLAERFEQTIEDELDKQWKAWVRTVSQRDGERTLIYVKPSGNNWELIVATLESHEATVIKMKVNRERMAEFLRDHHQVESSTTSGDN